MASLLVRWDAVQHNFTICLHRAGLLPDRCLHPNTIHAPGRLPKLRVHHLDIRSMNTSPYFSQLTHQPAIQWLELAKWYVGLGERSCNVSLVGGPELCRPGWPLSQRFACLCYLSVRSKVPSFLYNFLKCCWKFGQKMFRIHCWKGGLI